MVPNFWVSLLPIAQFAYNSAVSELIRILLFFANYKYQPDITKELLKGEEAPKTIEYIKELKSL